MVYSTGAAIASTIQIKNTVSPASTILWTNLQASSHGGGFYLDHTNLNLNMAVATKVTNSQSLNGMGGFLYVKNSKAITITGSEFLQLSSKLSGSFMYSQATTLQLSVSTSTVDCSNQGVTTAFTDLSANLLGLTSTKGGAFYIKDTPTQSVINQLTLRNCYTGDSGGAFTLINTELKDTSSTYFYTAALYGGAFYCKDCKMDLTSISFDNNHAHDGGVIRIEDLRTSGLTQSGILITNSKAYHNGGVFHVSGATTQTLDVSKISVTTAWAKNQGGVMYVDNSNQGILAKDLTVDTASADAEGGVFYFKNVATVAINKDTTKSTFKTVLSPIAGSFMYSVAANLKLHLDDAELRCTMTDLLYPTDTDPYLVTTGAVPTVRGGAFYIQDAIEVIANRNLYKNCYTCHQGGVYHLKNTPVVTDTNSDFINNAAVKGGVILAEKSTVTLNTARIQNSYAQSGGIFYFYDQSPLSVSASALKTSHAYDKGGVGNFEQLSSLTSAMITAANSYTISFDSSTTFDTHSAQNDGGSFYFNSEQISAITFDTVTLTSSNSLAATASGGFAYVAKVGTALLTITTSTFDTFKAFNLGSFLYSADDSLQFVIDTSTFKCSTTDYAPGYESLQLTATQGIKGGAFHVENSLLGIAVSASVFKNCYNSRQGGAFTLKSTKLTDDSSEYVYNSAN